MYMCIYWLKVLNSKTFAVIDEEVKYQDNCCNILSLMITLLI